MKRQLRAAVVSTSVLTIVGGVLAATVGTAAAATTPPWETGNANALGTLSFFNSSGVQITSGTNDKHIADYVLASSADPSVNPGNQAQLEFANPQNGVPVNSYHATLDEETPFPNGSAPGALGTTSNPVVSLDSNGGDLFDAVGGFDTTNPVTGFPNTYQVRVFTAGAGGSGTHATKYWTADIQINPSTNAWTEVFGSPVSTATSATATPNPAGAGSSVTLTATVTDADNSAPAGTVTFTSGGSTLGSSSTFNGSGAATVSTTALPQGDDTITATFVPSNAGSVTYAGSNGSTSEHVSAPIPGTTTTLGITGNSTTGTDAVLSGTVSPAGAGGTVSFFDGSSTTALNASPVAVTSGNYSYTLSGGFAAGTHSVVAKFTPTDPTQFGASQSAAVAFNTIQGAAAGSTCSQTGSHCSDTQTIQGTIPTGTLVISTPYTDANPLDLGTLALSADGTEWTGHAVFKCITITDASSGGSPFVASALANALNLVPGTGNPAQNTTNASTTINGENVGLTDLTLSAAGGAQATCPDGTTPTESYNGGRTVTNNPAASGVSPSDTGSLGLGGSTPHTIITGSAGGEGTVAYDGTLTLNAPTSTAAGTYKGTVIFTVTD